MHITVVDETTAESLCRMNNFNFGAATVSVHVRPSIALADRVDIAAHYPWRAIWRTRQQSNRWLQQRWRSIRWWWSRSCCRRRQRWPICSAGRISAREMEPSGWIFRHGRATTYLTQHQHSDISITERSQIPVWRQCKWNPVKESAKKDLYRESS